MEKIFPVGIATYKKSTRNKTINLIFEIILLIESFITCDLVKNFDHDSDNKPMLS